MKSKDLAIILVEVEIMRICIIASFVAMFIFSMASCGRRSNINDSTTANNVEITNDIDADVSGGLVSIPDYLASNIIGDYKYPENPAIKLRNSLENDVIDRSLPMTIGEVSTIVFGNRQYTQIKILFTDNGNECVILFLNRYIDFDVEVLQDGHDNPSFTMAFKYHENYWDMVMLLTSVLLHLSPDLSLDEAKGFAALQDSTISIDGFSMPLDIGGYQVQARYTYPHVFYPTLYFDAHFGVTVRATKQLWQGAIDTSHFYYISGPDDYHLFNISFWDESRHPEGIYADFIVTSTRHYRCWRHGSTSVTVDVLTMSGRSFTFLLDTWTRFHDPYEFGIGQKYTFFIGLSFNEGILYAIQRSESVEPNSRGQAQSFDVLSLDFVDSVRSWPEEDGTVLEVHFMTYAFGDLNIFFVLEGHGLGGDIVWTKEEYYPIRDDYSFHGWFDNIYFEGEPYTNETPIYQMTNLFAKWVYSGPGGIIPRAFRGEIHGIDNVNDFYVGQDISIISMGYNMNLELPEDKRFRLVPIAWRVSDGGDGIFSNMMPFTANISLNHIGEHVLYISYREEVFDGVVWQVTGNVREVRERLLTVR